MPGATIVLVGFMGAGKSRVGRALSRRLGVPFVDTDAVIVEQMGPIEQVFAEQGEAAFREAERAVVTLALEEASRTARVLALGGGAVTSTEVRQALVGLPHVVWLTAPEAVLFARATGSGRPLATDAATFHRLFEQRQSLYAEVAGATVANAGDRGIEEVVDEILVACRMGSAWIHSAGEWA